MLFFFYSISAPINTVAPAISGGVNFGDTLTVSNGTWLNVPTSYTYQWKRNGSNISSATNQTYVITASDFNTDITCTVTAINGGGNKSITSASVHVYTQYNHDNFTDTNGADITSHTGDYQATWTLQTGTTGTHAKIQSNRLYSNTTNNIYRLNISPSSANYETYARFYCVTELTNDNIGITGRNVSGANTYYFVRYSRATTSWGMFKMVAGVATQIGSSYTDAFAQGATRDVILKMNGTSLSVTIDGTERITGTDSDITGAGYGGYRGAVTQSSTTGIHTDFINVRELT